MVIERPTAIEGYRVTGMGGLIWSGVGRGGRVYEARDWEGGIKGGADHDVVYHSVS